MDMNDKQIYPPSITGKGARFAPGGSVLDHAFGKSDPYTLGVEEEYMLLDGETFDLVQHIETVLAAVAGHELEPVINPELMQSVLEIATPVCHAPTEVADQLRRIRAYVIDVARMRRSWSATSVGAWQTGVAISSTDCISSGLMTGSSSWPATAASTVSMCCTRSNVSPSSSMYSSSTPSVYGSLWPNAWSSTLPPGAKRAPLPVIDGG